MKHIIYNPGTWFPRSARWIRNPANPEDRLPHSISAEIEDNDDKMQLEHDIVEVLISLLLLFN